MMMGFELLAALALGLGGFLLAGILGRLSALLGSSTLLRRHVDRCVEKVVRSRKADKLNESVEEVLI